MNGINSPALLLDLLADYPPGLTIDELISGERNIVDGAHTATHLDALHRPPKLDGHAVRRNLHILRIAGVIDAPVDDLENGRYKIKVSAAKL